MEERGGNTGASRRTYGRVHCRRLGCWADVVFQFGGDRPGLCGTAPPATKGHTMLDADGVRKCTCSSACAARHVLDV
eukprot:2196608-Prymnesium_polylepis.1